MNPAVSVVIPTRGRPGLVRRAVETALAQSFSDLEVLVIIDGPDDATSSTLSSISDARLRVEVNEESVGGAQARNIGVEKARGEWIAFLDDDDEWLPRKVERQISVTRSCGEENVCVACKFIERSEEGERILPLRNPGSDEALSEYIYCPKGFSIGEGFLQTSTLLVKRSTLLQVPFLRGLACGQETTWLLRASRDCGLKLRMVPEPLVIFNDDQSRARISSAPKWQTLWNWARNNREYFTPKAYSFFVASCVGYALRAKEPPRVFCQLLADCAKGKPTIKCLLLFFYRWFMPTQLRRKSGRLLSHTLRVLRGQPA